VGDDLIEIIYGRPGEGEKAVVDPDHRLAYEVQTVFQEQVVGLIDAPSLGVLDRHDPVIHASHLDRLEHLADGGERQELGLGEQAYRTFFGVGPGLALVGNEQTAVIVGHQAERSDAL
jgi:hypothetical protein